VKTANPDNQNAVCITRFVEESSQMVFLYQGIQGMLFLPPLDFIRLSGAAKRNIAMFRDFSRSYFHGHIHPDWPDIEAAIANQRRILDDCGQATELFCAGTSTGAYCALLFGHYLKADIVYAFAAQTWLTDNVVKQIGVDLPPAHRDLSVLLSDWNGHTRYRLYYAQDFEPDRVDAERLADCPGVELLPLPGREHNIFVEVDPGEILPGLFPEPSGSVKG
jgi:hypothetical protein